MQGNCIWHSIVLPSKAKLSEKKEKTDFQVSDQVPHTKFGEKTANSILLGAIIILLRKGGDLA